MVKRREIQPVEVLLTMGKIYRQISGLSDDELVLVPVDQLRILVAGSALWLEATK